MTTQQAKPVGKTDYVPPPIEGDFYRIAATLNDSERSLLKRVREFTEGVVAPIIEDYWSRDAFPFEIIPKMAEVGIGGVGETHTADLQHLRIQAQGLVKVSVKNRDEGQWRGISLARVQECVGVHIDLCVRAVIGTRGYGQA